MHINDLPLEIFVKICSHLTIKEKFQNEHVCRYWQKNIFVSVLSLTFDNFGDVCCSQQNHKTSKDDWLPSKVNGDGATMNCILAKCGKYLRSFAGVVSSGTMRAIAENCERLQCANMIFEDLDSLMLLSDTFGQRLTCVTLYTNLRQGIAPFLAACSNLVTLTVRESHVTSYDLSEKYNSVQLFHHNSENYELPQSLRLVQCLMLDSCYITEETLKDLALFRTLDKLHIRLNHSINHSLQWNCVMTKWQSLRSLSLEVENYACVRFEPLPPNLENLSLKSLGYLVNCPDKKPIHFSSFLPKLKMLKMSLNGLVSYNITSLLNKNVDVDDNTLNLESVGNCSPALQKFCLCGDIWQGAVVDQQIKPILGMTSLTHLILGSHFHITDNLAAELITELEHLTFVGDYWNQECESLIPSGPRFWKNLIAKAVSHPSDIFRLIGRSQGILELHEPLPPNVYLELCGKATVNLSNGFSRSLQWLELTRRSSYLKELTLIVEDENLNLSGLPKSAECVVISCSNEETPLPSNALIFSTYLPKLLELKVFQKIMSNQQLGATLKCVRDLCPNVNSLFLHRENQDITFVDDHLTCLLTCSALHDFRLSSNFLVSDEFDEVNIKRTKITAAFPDKNGFVVVRANSWPLMRT